MPKIIEHVREQLLQEAKRQLAENGYAKTTIRSVAGACGLASGTVYNYFPSKDMLIASFMAEDWKQCIDNTKHKNGNSPEHILQNIYQGLLEFTNAYRSLFYDSDAKKVFATAFSERHPQLRSQLAEMILPICDASSVEDKVFLSEYIAESLLTWTIAGKSFLSQYQILQTLLK